MATIAGTQVYEGTWDETLYFEPSFHEDDIISQRVGIGTIEKNVAFITLFKLRKPYNMDHASSAFCILWFTPEETDLLIKALQEVKNRWENWEKWSKSQENDENNE